MADEIATAPERVRDKWNKTLEKQVRHPSRKFSWHNPIVQNFIRDHYLDGFSVSNYLVEHLGGRRIRNALDVAGGLGDQAITFHKLLDVERFDVLDISTVAVSEGQKRADAEGLNVHYGVSDLNTDPLPDTEYDLIIASGALHHIENLEHLFSEINQRLAPGGVFFANDYMGPSYMQWLPKQLEVMNSVVRALPDDLNRVAHRAGAVVKDVTPIPLDIFARHDPSEGVRAAEIFEVMKDHLDIHRIVPFGQTIAYEVLRGRIGNFDDDNPKDQAILSLICMLEKELIEAGVLQSDFNLVIAGPKAA